MRPALASSPQPSPTSARCSSPCVTASSRKFELLGRGLALPSRMCYHGPLSSHRSWDAKDEVLGGWSATRKLFCSASQLVSDPAEAFMRWVLVISPLTRPADSHPLSPVGRDSTGNSTSPLYPS